MQVAEPVRTRNAVRVDERDKFTAYGTNALVTRYIGAGALFREQPDTLPSARAIESSEDRLSTAITSKSSGGMSCPSSASRQSPSQAEALCTGMMTEILGILTSPKWQVDPSLAI